MEISQHFVAFSEYMNFKEKILVIIIIECLLSNDPYSFSKNSRCLEGAFGVEVFMMVLSVSVEVISICMVAINCMNLSFHLLYFHNFFFRFLQCPECPKIVQKSWGFFVFWIYENLIQVHKLFNCNIIYS